MGHARNMRRVDKRTYKEHADPGFRNRREQNNFELKGTIKAAVSRACHIPDEDVARAQLREIVDALCQAHFALKLSAIDARLSYLNARLDHAKASLEAAQKTEQGTPSILQTATSGGGSDVGSDGSANDHNNGGDDRQAGHGTEVPWRRWQKRHRVESLVIGTILPAALVASFVTAYSTLMGSGLPVFVERPYLAATLAMMAPSASMAVKLVSGLFTSDRGHRNFAISLNTVAIVFVTGWILLFADLYHGLGTSPVAGGLFDEPSTWHKTKETLFTALTLLSEVTVGAVMAARLDRLAGLYSPDHWVLNPKHGMAKAEVDQTAPEVERLHSEVAELDGQRDALKASIQSKIEMADQAFTARRSHFDGSLNI